MTSLEFALDMLARGLSVIPVPPPVPGTPANKPGDGKTPVVKWKRWQSELPSERQVRRWFRREQNVAVLTGALSGVVVVDLDGDDAVEWWSTRRPYTPWQTQTSRGFHVWYRHPGVEVRNKVHVDTGTDDVHIDIRGDRGYVIAHGRHMSGSTYQRAGDWKACRHRAPVFWPGWLATPERVRPPRRRVRAFVGGRVEERARRYLAAIPVPEIGSGSDDATYRAACVLARDFALDDETAFALLWEWAGDRPGWTEDWVRAKVAHARQYGRHQEGSKL